MSEPFRTRGDTRAAVRFTFDGRACTGRAGETLASALLANGVRLVGRSFKLHRPRGVFAAGVEEPSAHVTVDRGPGRVTPNLPATEVELYEGLVARSQNAWPSLRFDMGEAADLVSRFLPPGFYYKTFMWPAFAWRHVYEPLIRRAAGLGRAPREPDPDRYANRHAHCDALIVGAGPAGLAAALAASETGARVMLCEQDFAFGGALLREARATIDGLSAQDWTAQALATLAQRPNVQLLKRATAFGVYPHNLVGVAQRLSDHLAGDDANAPRQRLWQARAKRIVLAAGAIERPMIFPNNDRPGVMLADAARAYALRFGVLAGRRAVVVANHDSAWGAALDLKAQGVEVALIAETRAVVDPALIAAAHEVGIAIATSARVLTVKGRQAVRGVRLDAPGGVRDIACDLVLSGGGWTPTLHLYAHAKGALAYDEALGAFKPAERRDDIRCVGACAGALDLARALAQGFEEGAQAARDAGFDAPAPRAFTVERDWPTSGGAPPEGVVEGPAFVDLQNDVKAHDYALAAQEGFRSIEHVKRYTTSGLATDQGKTGSISASAMLAHATGRAPGDVGLTTYRAPYTPIAFGALAHMGRGALYDPVRETPTHARAAALGATFENAGQWRRARAFPRAGESEAQATAREALTVRGAAGLFDASTLGKIEVAGPHALAFLQKIYVNDLATLAIGRCRYGTMLTETGFVMDDGVIARLAENRYLVSTTSGGAAAVLQHMEDFRQTEFTHMRVWLANVTEQWATLALQGPRARDVLAGLVEGIDLAPDAMPHMSVREGRLRGAPLRLMRVSFSGELGYEISTPADFGASAWDALLDAGRPHGIAPYGLEALDVLRAEKGYIIIGQDTDGGCTPDDLGLARMVGRGKGDFVGARSLRLPHLAAAGRRQLVGLRVLQPARAGALEDGAQIVTDAAPAKGAHALGHVTTVRSSPTLGRVVALALVENGRARLGETLYATTDGGTLAVEIVSPVAFDSEGRRLHG